MATCWTYLMCLMLAAALLGEGQAFKECGLKGENRIIGGVDAEPGEFPWQVSLRSRGSHICGGTLITDRWVLTAAHCVEGQIALLDSLVVAGAVDRWESGVQKRNIGRMIAHDGYNTRDFRDDIALVELTEPVDFSGPNVGPACLPPAFGSEGYHNYRGTVGTCLVTGWGLTSGGGLFLPNILQKVAGDVLDQDQLNSIFDGYIKPSMIGFGKAGQSACNGDSGGPMVCPNGSGAYDVVGVVSFGYTGCTTSTVLTEVAAYREWMHEQSDGKIPL